MRSVSATVSGGAETRDDRILQFDTYVRRFVTVYKIDGDLFPNTG